MELIISVHAVNPKYRRCTTIRYNRQFREFSQYSSKIKMCLQNTELHSGFHPLQITTLSSPLYSVEEVEYFGFGWELVAIQCPV